jgi:hypothetical protein
MNNTNKILISIVSLILFLMLSGPAFAQDTVYGTISGDIQEGVTVTIYQPNCGGNILVGESVTNSEGYYSFSGLEAGRYLLFVDHTGYSFGPEGVWVDIPQEDIQPYDFTATADFSPEKIGVIYILHGGMEQYTPQYMWEASIHQFSYEVSHPVYKLSIWNSGWWSAILQSEEAVKFLRKYEFEYERIGGFDPFHELSDRQLADMKTELRQEHRRTGL